MKLLNVYYKAFYEPLKAAREFISYFHTYTVHPLHRSMFGRVCVCVWQAFSVGLKVTKKTVVQLVMQLHAVVPYELS